MGYRPKGIRIDSGDITYLSRVARKMLDEAGFPDCRIVASKPLMNTSSMTSWFGGRGGSVWGWRASDPSRSEPVWQGI